MAKVRVCSPAFVAQGAPQVRLLLARLQVGVVAAEAEAAGVECADAAHRSGNLPTGLLSQNPPDKRIRRVADLDALENQTRVIRGSRLSPAHLQPRERPRAGAEPIRLDTQPLEH